MKKQFEDNKERKPAGVFITVWPCYRLEATALDLVLLVILYFTILAILKNQKALTSCNPKAIAFMRRGLLVDRVTYTRHGPHIILAIVNMIANNICVTPKLDLLMT